MPPWMVAALAYVGVPLLLFAYARLFLMKRRLAARFKSVVDLDAELKKVRGEIESHGSSRKALLAEYQVGAANLKRLREELQQTEEVLEVAEYGLHRPHFTFEHSETYKAAIERVRREQKEMIRQGFAAKCAQKWEVGGSAKAGAKMVKQAEKLILRAFNGESEAAIANVDWKNCRVMEVRIRKAFSALNDLGTVLMVSVDERYLDLRLKELRLVFEFAEKKQEEREEQKRIREQMREEERVQRELERAKEQAEADETRFEKSLEAAREQAERALGEKRDEFALRITQLEAELAAAHERKERAISRAQMTRQGHVYVISNLGSFGEGVLKIGMTRRLDPHERIFELGDASVPFPFDVHAMLFSEDAPALEAELHRHFWDHRLNHANDRKEFFRVELAQIEEFARKKQLKIEMTMLAEAKQYKQTIATIAELKAKIEEAVADATRAESLVGFPSDPFAVTSSTS